jgi:hypothetical protein
MTDLVEVLRNLVENELEWKFCYARRDFDNIVEADSANDTKNYFFLDPISRVPVRDQFGGRTGQIDYEGYFMILSKSDLDEVYDGQNDVNPNDGKYKKYIQPKLAALANDFENKLACVADITIVRTSISDIINIFNDNFDGILVNFKFSQYE